MTEKSDLSHSGDWKNDVAGCVVVYLSAVEQAAIVWAVKRALLDGGVPLPGDVVKALETGLSELEGRNDA